MARVEPTQEARPARLGPVALGPPEVMREVLEVLALVALAPLGATRGVLEIPDRAGPEPPERVEVLATLAPVAPGRLAAMREALETLEIQESVGPQERVEALGTREALGMRAQERPPVPSGSRWARRCAGFTSTTPMCTRPSRLV